MNEIQVQLGLAAKHLQSGRTEACQAICDALLDQNPGMLAACNLRGLALALNGDHSAAIRDLSRVWATQKENKQAAMWLGRLYRIQGEYQLALPALRAAVTEKSLELDARYELARVFTRLRKTMDAIHEYQKLLSLNPSHVDAMANLAFLYERANRLAEAEQMADRAIQMDARNFMAQLTRATLDRRNGLPVQAQSRLELELQRDHPVMNRSILLNQLGQSLLAQGSFGPAFEAFEAGNAILRHQHPLGRPVEDGSYGLQTIARFQSWLSKNPPADWSKTPADPNAEQLVFLVGFPRSGTTLMDQALSAHEDIEVLEEYEFFDEVRKNWVDGSFLDRLAQMSPNEINTARQQYRQALQTRRSTGKRCVVDKLPLNLVYLFLIYRLFPDAPVIFMLRDPRDACLSCYFQSFDLQGAMPYFLDLESTAGYYHAAMNLAHKSLEVISNPVFHQRYEKLVTDFESAMRSVVQFLDLPWSEEVLQYRQKTKTRVIDTPSYQQVTRPLYQDSIARWRYFSEQLEPIQAQLSPWVDIFSYPTE